MLLDAGALVDQANKNGTTPLYIAAEDGQVKCVQLLLSARAAVDQAKNDGVTPLCVAAAEGQEKCVQLLLRAGAVVNQVDKYGRTPLYMASLAALSGDGGEKCVKLLLRAGGRRMTWSCFATLLRCRNPLSSTSLCCLAPCFTCKGALAGENAKLAGAADHDTRSDPRRYPTQQQMA